MFVVWAHRQPVCSANELPWSELTSTSLDEVQISDLVDFFGLLSHCVYCCDLCMAMLAM